MGQALAQCLGLAGWLSGCLASCHCLSPPGRGVLKASGGLSWLPGPGLCCTNTSPPWETSLVRRRLFFEMRSLKGNRKRERLPGLVTGSCAFWSKDGGTVGQGPALGLLPHQALDWGSGPCGGGGWGSKGLGTSSASQAGLGSLRDFCFLHASHLSSFWNIPSPPCSALAIKDQAPLVRESGKSGQALCAQAARAGLGVSSCPPSHPQGKAGLTPAS